MLSWPRCLVRDLKRALNVAEKQNRETMNGNEKRTEGE